MSRKFTKLPSDTATKLQINAGVLLNTFEPSTGTISEEAILCASSGGFNFTDSISFKDWGEDVDNCPKNTKELKEIESREVKLTGTSVTATPELLKKLAGAGAVLAGKVTPSDVLSDSDFADLWWVGDYGSTDGGLMAIHLKNALSTGGISFQSSDKEKGKFNFEFTAHYSLADESVPYEIYVQDGAAA